VNHTVFRVEWYRWLRTRRLVALVSTFVLFGFLSLLGAKYLPDLIGRSSDIELLHAPDWRDGLQQYVKNTGLLLAAVSIVLSALACAVRRDEPVGIYYLSREVSPVRLYTPRILTAAVMVATGALLGAAVALYECRALFGPFPLGAAVSCLAAQWLAVVGFAVLAAAVAARTGSVGIAAATTAAVYVIGLIGATVPSAQPYLPTTALQPKIGAAGISLADTAKSLAALAILVALALTAAMTTRLRTVAGHKPRRPGAGNPPRESSRRQTAEHPWSGSNY
jgi:hypothetical protein